MSKRFRLEPLIGIRARRLDRARQAVLDARRVLAERIAERDQVNERIAQTTRERQATQTEQIACGSVDKIQCAERRLEWLHDRAVDQQRELSEAEKAISQAQQIVLDALAVMRQAQKKNDAILEQRRNWRMETVNAVIRAEEELSDELAGRRLVNRK